MSLKVSNSFLINRKPGQNSWGEIQKKKKKATNQPQVLDMIRAYFKWHSRATETWVNKSNRTNALYDIHRLKLRQEWEERSLLSSDATYLPFGKNIIWKIRTWRELKKRKGVEKDIFHQKTDNYVPPQQESRLKKKKKNKFFQFSWVPNWCIKTATELWIKVLNCMEVDFLVFSKSPQETTNNLLEYCCKWRCDLWTQQMCTAWPGIWYFWKKQSKEWRKLKQL